MTVLDFAAGASLYGLALFEPGPERLIRNVLATFDSPRAADLFAVENGFSDYIVCPVVMFVRPVRPASCVANRRPSTRSRRRPGGEVR